MKHKHSRYTAGCPACELDRLYVRICLTVRFRRDEATVLWHAKDMGGLTALWAQAVGS